MSNGRKRDHQTNMAVLQKYREATAKSGSSSHINKSATDKVINNPVITRAFKPTVKPTAQPPKPIKLNGNVDVDLYGTKNKATPTQPKSTYNWQEKTKKVDWLDDGEDKKVKTSLIDGVKRLPEDVSKGTKAITRGTADAGKYLGKNIVYGLEAAQAGTRNAMNWLSESIYRGENKIISRIMELSGVKEEEVPKKIKEIMQKNTYLADKDREAVVWENDQTQKKREKLESEKPNLPGAVNSTIEFVGQAAQMTPTVLMSVANPAYGTAYLAMESMGRNYAEAVADGADYNEATTYAVGATVVEIALEKIGGNKMFGGKTLTDAAMDKAAQRIIKNKTAQKLIRGALENNAEGIEEVATSYIQPLIKKIAYADTYEAPTSDEVIESYLGGVIGSAVWQGAGTAVNKIGEKASGKLNLPPVVEKSVDTLPPAGAFKEQNGNFDSLPEAGAFKENIDLPRNMEELNQKANTSRVVHSTDIPSHLKNTVENIKKRTGLDVVLGRRYNADGSVDNSFRGYFDGEKIVVSENATKRDIFNTVVLHELTHSIEGTKQYSEIEKYIIDKKYGGDTESFNRDIASKIEEYKQRNASLDDGGAKAEIIASNVEEYIFADDVRSIVEQDYTFGQRVYDFITELIYKIKNKYGTAVDIDHLKNAQRKYRQALDEVRRNGVGNISSEQYDIYDMGDHRRVVVTNDIVNETGVNTRSKIKKFIDRVYDEIEVSLPDGTRGITYVTERGAKEYAYSEYTKRLRGTKKYDKYRMADNIDEIIKAQIESEYEDPNHLRDDDIVGFYRSPIEVQVGNRLYDCELVTGITKDGREEFYDVVNMNLKNKNEPHPTLANRISVKGRRDADSFDNIVPQNKTIVNNNYMQNYNNNATEQKTDFEIAYEKALEKKKQGNGQYSFATEQNPETSKFVDESGNEYENVAPEAEEFGVRILEGKDNTGKDILEIDVDNPDIDSVISSEEYKRLIENAFDIKEVRGNTLTAERAFEKAFGKNYESFRKVVYDNLDKSKLQYMNVLDYLTKGLEENVVKRGIKKGSKDSELMQKYGEGLITQSELMNMTDNWQNIVEADRYMRKMYDALIDSINATKARIYPYIEEQETELRNELDDVNRKLDLIEQGELTAAMPIKKADKVQRARYLENAIANIEKNSERAMSVIDKQISSVQESMDKKINTGTKAYAELENRLTNLKAKQKRLKEFFELSKAKKSEQLAKLLDEYKDSDDLFGGVSKKVKDDLIAKRNRIEDELNDELRWRGKRIPKRKDYYHHFQEFSNSILGELLNKRKNNISAELVLVSENTKPKSKWESFAQRRKGTDTVYDAVGGYLDYIDAAAYAMTIDPNISIIRKLTQDIIHETSSSNPNTLGTNNANATIQRLDALANELAGKTVSKIDRVVQDAITRKNFRITKNIVNRMKAAAIVGNVGSAVVQVSNLPNAIGTLENKTNIITAISDSWAEVEPGKNNLYDAIMNRTEIQKQSPFLRERYFDSKSQFDTGVLSNIQKFTNWMLTVGDESSTRLSWNAFYREALSKGVENPIQYADSKTRKIVGGRGLGEKSLAQQSATLAAAFPFTLEVSNAWQVQKDLAKDLYKGIKQGDIKQVSQGVGNFLALYISTALIATALKEIRGSDGGMFNPVGIIFKNLCDYFFGDDEEDEENVFLKTTQEIAGNFVGSLPMGQKVAEMWPETGMEIGGKKIASRAELFGSEDPTRYGTSNLLTSALKHPLTSFVPGGSQIRKTVDAAKVLNDGGVYDTKGNLKYTVDKNAENYVKGLLFGKSALDETKEFYDEDRNALTADETKEYEYRVQQGENSQDVYNEIYQRKIDSATKSAENKAYREKTEGMVNEFDYGTSLKLDKFLDEYKKQNPEATSISVPTASKVFSYDGRKYNLTEEQCAELQNMYNDSYYNGIKDLINDESLDNEQKYNKISAVRKNVQNSVKKQFAKEVLGYTNPQDELDQYMGRASGTNQYQKELDEYMGRSTSGSKKNKYQQELEDYMNGAAISSATPQKNPQSNSVKNKYQQELEAYMKNAGNSNIGFKNYKVTNNNGGKHKGMDFAVPEGTAIQSTTSGVVTEVLSLRDSYGKFIVVKDASGNNHYYAHLSGFNCKIGDKVNRGQVIGYSGNTGNSSGPHLHYEVRQGDDYGKQIDPRSYL